MQNLHTRVTHVRAPIGPAAYVCALISWGTEVACVCCFYVLY